MVDRTWRDAACVGTVRAGDVIFALGRVAQLGGTDDDAVLSASMLYFPGTTDAMAWAGDGRQLAIARLGLVRAASAEPWFACVPRGFVAALRARFERDDVIELARGSGSELLVRRADEGAGTRARATLAQPLWDPAAHLELYNAVAAAAAPGTAALVHAGSLLTVASRSTPDEVVTVEVTPDAVLVRGREPAAPIPARVAGAPGAIAVHAERLAAAARAVSDVKHPTLQLELVEDAMLRVRGIRNVQPAVPGDVEVIVHAASHPAPARPPQTGPPAEARFIEPEAAQPVDEILAELDAIVGQDALKEQLRRLQNQVATNRHRRSLGLEATQLTSHMVFAGPPGTGKTTVARLVAKLYHALGVLENAEITEVDRADLVSQNVGGTEEKTKAIIEQASGGVLFIDEAYTLAQGGENDFGKKAIDVLLKALDDKRDSFVCIIAGYTDQMRDFVQSNPGLRSRFRRNITFAPYSPDELVRIAAAMARAGDNLLSDEAEDELRRRLVDEQRRGGFEDAAWGNARAMRNVVESAVEHRDDRITGTGVHDRDSLMTVHAADIARACDDDKIGHIGASSETVEDVLAELDAQVGQPQLKRQVRAIIADARVVKAKLDRGADHTGVSIEHLLFQGPPGTGKTTVARLIARLYRALGLLPKDEIVEVSRQSLVSGYRGQTALQTAKKIDEALGGVLFIDEAYTLVAGDDEDPGREAISTLLPRLENDAGKFLAIAAGYPDDMAAFVAANVGLRSRFTTTIDFEPYTADELVLIGVSMAAGRGEKLTDAARAVLHDRLHRAQRSGAFEAKDWGNARSVRTLVGRAVQQRNLRIDVDGTDDDALSTLEEVDLMSACDIEGIGRTSQRSETAADILAELDAQIGQDELKKQVRTLVAQAELALARRDAGIDDGPVPLDHLVFAGPPGTGKTTIARLLGRLYHALGLLPSTTIVEVDRSVLVGSHIGETEKRTRAKIDEAMGGILFIDEAYALARGGTNDFGREAIDNLVPRLENDRGKFLTIVAGYPADMAAFLRANSGLPSRFPTEIAFHSYSTDELVRIGVKMATDAGQRLDEGAARALRSRLERAERAGMFEAKEWGNARSVRNIIDASRRERDLRLHEGGYADPSELITIAAADVEAACTLAGL